VKGRRAEAVAQEAVQGWSDYDKLKVPVQQELADQLLLPMALAGEGRFVTGPLTGHARTNLHVIGRFLDARFDVSELRKGAVRVAVV